MEFKDILKELYQVIEERKANPIEGSYTNYLLSEGIDKILKKVGEEASEVIIASKNNDANETVKEISDLIYHVLVLLSYKDIELSKVVKELEGRRAKICNKKEERIELQGIH